MVGKKWRKAAAAGIAGVLAVGVLAGCGSSSGTGSNNVINEIGRAHV